MNEKEYRLQLIGTIGLDIWLNANSEAHAEEQVLFSDIKRLLPSKPIIGQRRGKTIWLVFFKG